MKYIRTKDGRIIAFGEKYAYPTRCSNGKTYFSFKELTEDRFEVMKEYNHWEVLKQADTIDELCDLYIDEETQIIFHKHNGYVINWKTNYVYTLKEVAKYFHSVKGAIYTSKGLIYVAKINDKGELELI